MALFRFAFHEEFRELEIPERSVVKKINIDPLPALDDVYGETRRALGSPVGTEPLKGLAGGRVLIAVPDRSRRTDIRELLRAVLDELAAASVKRGNITIIFALGTHRPMAPEEIDAKLGEGIAGSYRVENHQWDDPSRLVDLEAASDGRPVQFNRLIREHDFIMSIGTVGAHPVGGYSGGAKGLLPGIAGQRSTDYFHWEATKYPLFDIFGNADNPVRREMERIVAAAGLDFIVNVIENEDRRIASVFAGHFIQAHRAAVAFLKQRPLLAFPAEQPDIMAVGLGTDRPDFWGGAAGIYAAAALLKPGGVLVLFAACPEGVAPEHPVVLEYGYPRWREVPEGVERGTIEDLTGASHLVTVGRILEEKRMSVHIVSKGIGPDDARKLGFRWFESGSEALAAAIGEKGSNARILAYERI